VDWTDWLPGSRSSSSRGQEGSGEPVARTSQADPERRGQPEKWEGESRPGWWLGDGLALGRARLGWVSRLGRAALRAGVARQDVREDGDPGRGAGRGVRDRSRPILGASPCALDQGLLRLAGRQGALQSPRLPQGPVGWPTAS